MLFKIKKFLFKLKGKTIGWSPSGDYENYKKYILEDENIEKLNCSSRYTRNQRKIINKINEIIDKVNKGE